MKCFSMVSIPYQKYCENVAVTFHAIIQEVFWKGVLIIYCKIFLQDFKKVSGMVLSEKEQLFEEFF